MLQLIITATLFITGIITVEEAQKTNSSSNAKTYSVSVRKSEKTALFKIKNIHWEEKNMNQKNENEKATI
ncbi:hypothetical protein [Flavobacterium sp.]|uniref:hypothetical protein n=1 Tax=Flavobacterium sp. TaxID=239 RepID=UPI0026130BAC|nr:hypothetical protein [Flavobacterium sp.]MDD3004795.1 hypothetical protein [Flavobacterium sp.]